MSTLEPTLGELISQYQQVTGSWARLAVSTSLRQQPEGVHLARDYYARQSKLLAANLRRRGVDLDWDSWVRIPGSGRPA